MNEHDKLDLILFDIQYIKSILENNDKTGQLGVVQQQVVNTKDISVLKTDKKITAGKVGVAGLIFGTVGAILLKLLGVIKFVL